MVFQEGSPLVTSNLLVEGGSNRAPKGMVEKRNVVFVETDLPENQKACSTCGLPFRAFPGTTDSDVVEIQVKAHVRRFQRKRYQRTCHCPQTPGIIVAPVPPKLIAKGKLRILSGLKLCWASMLLALRFTGYYRTFT